MTWFKCSGIFTLHSYTYSCCSKYCERSLKRWIVTMTRNMAGHQLDQNPAFVKMTCKFIQFQVYQLFKTLVRLFRSLLIHHRGKEQLIMWFIYFIESSDKKDLKSTRTCLKDNELSPTDELSRKENSCLISPLSKTKPLAFGKYPSHYLSFFKPTSKSLYYCLLIIDVHIKEVPADVKKPLQDAPGRDISDAFPVCVQLPTNHLKNAHITAFKATHRHSKISHSSTSTLKSRLSLKAPAEGKQHLKLHLTQWNEGFNFYDI